MGAISMHRQYIWSKIQVADGQWEVETISVDFTVRKVAEGRRSWDWRVEVKRKCLFFFFLMEETSFTCL